MALETITEINIDVNQPGLEVVHAKQYDTVRKVKAHLFYNGTKWLVPSSNYEAVVAFKKADRIGGFYDATEDGEHAVSVDANDRSTVTIILDRNTVTTVGNVTVEITFYDTITNGRLSTFSFILQVESASLTELDLASNPYFNVLAADISAVLQAEQQMVGLTATASKLAPSSDPTVTVTGGMGTGNPYNLAFGIPEGVKGDKGDKSIPTSATYAYAVSTSGSTVPSSGWSSTASPQNGKYLWSRAIISWDGGGTSTAYGVSYIGMDGTGSTASEIIASDHLTVQDHLNTDDLVIDIASVSSLPRTIANSAVTENHVLSEAVLGTPNVQISDWTVTTTNGSVVISGSISGSTTLRLFLTRANIATSP